jgi:phage head maturation protease
MPKSLSVEEMRATHQPEFKSLPMQTKAIDGRTVTTLFSLAGNVDSTGDIVQPGAFTQTIAQRGTKIFHLFMHAFDQPPIAIVKAVREVPRDALPPEILAQFPEATGGTEAVSEFLTDARSDAIFQAIKAGAPFEASFGFDAIKYDFTQPDPAQPPIRNLREVRLYEVSTVLWGANPGTLGSKMLTPLDTLLHQLSLHLAEMKAGARHSAADVKALNAIHAAALELGATNCKGLVDDTADAAKSRADLVSLTQLQQKLEILKLECNFIHN